MEDFAVQMEFFEVKQKVILNILLKFWSVKKIIINQKLIYKLNRTQTLGKCQWNFSGLYKDEI